MVVVFFFYQRLHLPLLHGVGHLESVDLLHHAASFSPNKTTQPTTGSRLEGDVRRVPIRCEIILTAALPRSRASSQLVRMSTVVMGWPLGHHPLPDRVGQDEDREAGRGPPPVHINHELLRKDYVQYDGNIYIKPIAKIISVLSFHSVMQMFCNSKKQFKILLKLNMRWHYDCHLIRRTRTHVLYFVLLMSIQSNNIH